MRMILSPFEHFLENSGETVPKTAIIHYFFDVSKLLKYSFLVVLSSFLQKICCVLYFHLASCDLVLKKLLRNLDLFIIFLCNSFVIKGASFAQSYWTPDLGRKGPIK